MLWYIFPSSVGEDEYERKNIMKSVELLLFVSTESGNLWIDMKDELAMFQLAMPVHESCKVGQSNR